MDLLKAKSNKMYGQMGKCSPGKHVVFLLCVSALLALIASLHETGLEMIDFTISYSHVAKSDIRFLPLHNAKYVTKKGQ